MRQPVPADETTAGAESEGQSRADGRRKRNARVRRGLWDTETGCAV